MNKNHGNPQIIWEQTEAQIRREGIDLYTVKAIRQDGTIWEQNYCYHSAKHTCEDILWNDRNRKEYKSVTFDKMK